MNELSEFASVFSTLFLVMDPLVTLPIFTSFTKGKTSSQRVACANSAIATAGVVFLLFALLGNFILEAIHLEFKNFQVAGGLVLLVMGLQLALDFEIPGKKKESPAFALIGVPLITGPGVISSSILLVQEFGMVITVVSGFAALAACWFLLLQADLIEKTIGKRAIAVSSRIIGLMLVALAIQFARSGLGA